MSIFLSQECLIPERKKFNLFCKISKIKERQRRVVLRGFHLNGHNDLEDSSTGLILGVQYSVFLLNNANFKFKVKSNSEIPNMPISPLVMARKYTVTLLKIRISNF